MLNHNLLNYNKSYLAWKNWNLSNFALLDRKTMLYYNAELKKTKREYSNVLEIGFGNGKFLTYAKNKQWNIKGTESNEVLIDIAKQKGFEVYNENSLDFFEESSFDLVVAFNVLEHIAPDEVDLFLLKIKRILKNKGVFIATFPNGDSSLGLPNQNGDHTHKNFIGSGKIYHFSYLIDANIIYMGASAEPFLEGTLLGSIYRLITIPIKKILEISVKILFFPKTPVVIFATNRTLIFEMNK